MRRKDKEIKEIAAMERIIRAASVCRLAMSESGYPYVVPLCFGYKDRTLYFHSAAEGRKIDILKKNNNVCFEFDLDQELVRDAQACAFGMKFRSVIGFGKASLLKDAATKRNALDIIVRNYSDTAFSYSNDAVENTLIIEVKIESMTGKVSGR